MSATLLATLLYGAWSLALLGAIVALRNYHVFVRGRRANAFLVNGEDVSPFAARLARAHANCYENLPVFLALVLVAQATGQTALTDPLAPWLLAARVAQSSVHLYSTRVRFVALRFVFLLTQYAIQVIWVVRLLGTA